MKVGEQAFIWLSLKEWINILLIKNLNIGLEKFEIKIGGIKRVEELSKGATKGTVYCNCYS